MPPCLSGVLIGKCFRGLPGEGSAFREAYESYKATVNRVYVESKEKGADASQHLRRAHRVASANPFPISFKKLIPHKSGEELICHLTKDI